MELPRDNDDEASSGGGRGNGVHSRIPVPNSNPNSRGGGGSKVPPYVVGETELEASKEGRTLTNFKYARIGYSVYLDNKDSSADSKDKTAKLPYCVGLEVLLLEKSSTSADAHVPAHAHKTEELPAKKQKRKQEVQPRGPQFQRRCSHCQVQKTPQWRTGPLGPKTLCNACGVRFKSGRLFPEYRPACSPTFSGDIHSNSHREVLEMRRRKEADGAETGLDRAQMAPSC